MAVMDLGATLFFQPAAYWEGDRHHAVEWNPVLLVAMWIHPGAVLIVALATYAAVMALTRILPAAITADGIIFLTLGHAAGACGWLYRHQHFWPASWLAIGCLVWLSVIWIRNEQRHAMMSSTALPRVIGNGRF